MGKKLGGQPRRMDCALRRYKSGPRNLWGEVRDEAGLSQDKCSSSEGLWSIKCVTMRGMAGRVPDWGK